MLEPRDSGTQKIITVLTAPKPYISFIFVIVGLPKTLEDLIQSITPAWELL